MFFILQCSSWSSVYLLLASSTFINLKLQTFIFVYLPLLLYTFIYCRLLSSTILYLQRPSFAFVYLYVPWSIFRTNCKMPIPHRQILIRHPLPILDWPWVVNSHHLIRFLSFRICSGFSGTFCDLSNSTINAGIPDRLPKEHCRLFGRNNEGSHPSSIWD